MRNILNSTTTPPSLAPKTAQTSLGSRILEAITGGPGRRFSGHHSPAGGAASPSVILNRRIAFPILMLVAALAVGVLFLLPGGPLHAQAADPIEYPENDTAPVATFTAIDPEGESVSWPMLTGTDAADFSIDNGVLRFRSPPDFEDMDAPTDNTYTVTVQASDGGANTTAMEDVTVRVTNVEEAGMIMLSTLQPQVGVVVTATLSDGDGIGADNLASIEWQWYRGNTPIAGATLGGGSVTSTYTPAAGDIGSLVSAKAMYDDDEGDDKMAEQDAAHVAREAPTSNVPPTFPTPAGQTNTDQTREIAENTPAGTNIGDPVAANDTDVLSYSLGGTHEGNFDINRATGQLITKAALDHETLGSYSVTVQATDPFGSTPVAPAAVTISVVDVNEDPELSGAATIDIAENQTNLGGAGTADEYTVTDEDEDDDVSEDADITWTLSGADSSKFDITTTGATSTISFKDAPSFESPGDSDGNNVYDVTVVVTDTDSNTDSQAVMVKVTNVEEMGMITLSTLQPRVGFLVTATLADPDNVDVESLEWQWYRGGSFSITDVNFETFVPTALPNNECNATTTTTNCSIKDATSGSYVPVSADVANALTAVATYTDGNANEADGKDYAATSAAHDPLVATTNERPKFPDQDDDTEGVQTAQERNIAENTAAAQNIGDAVAAMDEDTVLTYALGGPDATSFGIVDNSGQLQTKAALDKETKDTYTVTVTATDSFGASSTITVTINVTDVDEMPELTGEAPEEYAENGAAAVATFRATDPEGKSIIWDLNGADNEDFSIEGGVLRFEESPDYEVPADQGSDNTYEVTIQASDGGQNTTATMAVSIEVTNVDEDGTVMLSTLQPQVGVEVTATLTDPDNATPNTITWQWYRGSSPISGANDGANTEMSTYMPAAGDNGSTLRAEAMYDDGEDEDKSARGNSFRSVRAAPGSNTAPVFPDQNLNEVGVQKDQTKMVAENTAAGTNVGPAVSANDPGDLLTYALSGNGAASFDIVRSSGQIRTKSALDFETTPSYSVTVTATDPSGTMDQSRVTIMVTDVNEDPTFTAGVMSIDHEEATTVLDADGSAVNIQAAGYTISDQDIDDDAADLDWDLTGADGDLFELTDTTATRTLSFKDAPDFESPTDSGADNVYNVTVEVTDSDGNTAERAVTIKVTNLEEAGMVELSTLQPRIGFPITATLADADNITAGSVSWQWYKGNVPAQADLMTLDEAECDDGTNTNNCFIKGATSATYTPGMNDGQDTLVAVALYTDGSQNEPADAKDFAMAPTANTVLADTRNKAPVFEDQDDEMDGDQTDQTRMVSENVPATEPIRLVGAVVTAMDFITANDGTTTVEILTYTMGGPDADSFTINRSTAQISTKADVPLDKEAKDTYTVTVTATDPSGLQATINVTITVTNVDEAPMIMVGGLAISGTARVDYAEDRRDAVATYAASGPDADMATWSLEGDDAGDFMTEGSGMSAMLKFRSTPDYEMPMGGSAGNSNTYTVTVKADDGTYSDTHDVTVTVTNVAELGTLTGEASFAYPENGTDAVETYTANGPVPASWSLGGDDMGAFDIGGSSGVLMFASPPDYESSTAMGMDNMYMVTVMAAAGGETGTMDVTVNVTNQEEPGTVALSNPSPLVDDVVMADLTDPDGSVTEMTWQWARTMDMADGWTDIMGADMASYTATSDDDGYYLQATATYTDGEGADKSAMATTVNPVTPAPDQAGSVSLSPTRPKVGDEVTATLTDPDGMISAEVWQWSRSMDMTTWMDIADANSVTYTVMETDHGYYLRATVNYTDGHGAGKSEMMDTASAVIIVEDQLGAVSLSPTRPQVGEEVVASLADPDGMISAQMWQWSRSMDPMDTTSWMEIQDANSATYTPVVMDGGYYLRATVSYTDGHGAGKSEMMDTASAVPVVEDLLGTVSLSPTRPQVGEEVVASLADPDGMISAQMWQWSRSMDPMDTTSWMEIQDANSATYTPVVMDGGYYLRATVSYTDGHGAGKSEMMDTASAVPVVEDLLGTVSLSPTRPQVGEEVVASLADPDGMISAQMWQWSRSMDPMDTTPWMEIQDANSATYTPVETDGGYYLRATVSYTDGHGAGKSEMMDTASAVPIVEDLLGTVSLSPTRPQVGEEVVASLADPDGMISAQMWQWSRSMDPMDTTPWMEIQDANSATYTPVGTDEGYYLRATVSYTDGHGAGKSEMMDTASAVGVASLADRYDTNPANGMIDKAEVIDAINDYLFGDEDVAISKAEVIELINLYLFGS